MTDPSTLEAERARLLDRLTALRLDLATLDKGYATLQSSGVLLDTDGIGALTTPEYCVAGAREVFEEAMIELDAAADAVERAQTYTARLRSAAFE
ncbi:hypothetical protein [Nocardia callitridis]|uniref:ESX-1 secretion-associated protein n=1 Tax=Nocardia callitridis TaxID=648753 RepID=A0ABP9KIH1_9NOCA